MSKLSLFAFGMFALLAAVGCGGDQTRPGSTVSGKVTLASGGPLPGGRIEFRSTSGQLLGTGTIKADGTYEALSIAQGECKLSIENADLKGIGPPPAGTGAMPGADRKYVPIDPKYTKVDTSGLTVNVNQPKVVFDIQLK